MENYKNEKEHIDEVRKMLVELGNSYEQSNYNIEEQGLLKLELTPEVLKSVLFNNRTVYPKTRYKFDNSLEESNILKYIDLSDLDFTNFDFRHENFTGLHNVKINPQDSFDKCMYYFTSGKAQFIGEGDIFEDVSLDFADFTEAHEYYLNPQTVSEKNLKNFKSGKAIFVGKEDLFEGVRVSGANFTGAHALDSDTYQISPKTVNSKNLKGFTSGRAEFIGDPYPFFYAYIQGANFTDAVPYSINLSHLLEGDCSGFVSGPAKITIELCQRKRIILTNADFSKADPYTLDIEDVHPNLKGFKSGKATIVGFSREQSAVKYVYDCRYADFSMAEPYYDFDTRNAYIQNFTTGPANFVGRKDNFENVRIDGLNPKGSKNCVVNTQTVESIKGLIPNDVTFIGPENMWDGYDEETINQYSNIKHQMNPNMEELSNLMRSLEKLK